MHRSLELAAGKAVQGMALRWDPDHVSGNKYTAMSILLSSSKMYMIRQVAMSMAGI